MGGCLSTEAFDNAVLVPHKTVSIVHPKFASPVPVTLRIKEKMWSWSGDDFSIKDVHTDVPYFKVDGSAFSWREKKTLRDYQGNVLAYMEEPMMSFTNRQEVFTPDMRKWFDITPRITMFENVLDCHVVDCTTGQRYSFGISGDWLVHKSVITCDGVPVAKVSRLMSFTDEYCVEIASGIDMAFIVLLCVALDEAGSD
ncbi:hypothetical protein H310_07529 [Aphanomyces invadans]|uniref:Tubby C-terminal domain-containing protein n=1 Tax=Aphanomyces invadans TaxID=157072 RepID=A0A024U3B4_9STRA|nr:hypothetical protein H310_07529 [Aphanomyces invadans]ETW00113.1 hypothetical protein H310_07529 [Aphanomyces invadans]|eukprot:XP_008871138.1 hypothetical protein H310_07529 [Aphanomyces invadans]